MVPYNVCAHRERFNREERCQSTSGYKFDDTVRFSEPQNTHWLLVTDCSGIFVIILLFCLHLQLETATQTSKTDNASAAGRIAWTQTHNVIRTAALDRLRWKSLRPSFGLTQQWVSDCVMWVTIYKLFATLRSGGAKRGQGGPAPHFRSGHPLPPIWAGENLWYLVATYLTHPSSQLMRRRRPCMMSQYRVAKSSGA